LIGAGLFVRSMDNARSVDHGYEPDGLYFVDLVATSRDAIPPADRVVLMREMLERLQRLPEVQSVASTSSMPFWSYQVFGVEIEGVDSLPTLSTGGAYAHVVSPRYLETMGMDLVRGRGHGDGSAHVAGVNETLAGIIASYGEPVGRCLYLRPEGVDAPPCIEIAGVVEDATSNGLDEDPVMQYYVTLPQGSALADRFVNGATLLVRSNAEEGAVIGALRREILAADPRIRFADIRPFEQMMAPLTRSWELGATLFTVFGLLALLVAGVGLYSVLAFDVAQRTRELGLRTALGAPEGRLLAMVVGRGMRVTLVGIAAGLLVAALL